MQNTISGGLTIQKLSGLHLMSSGHRSLSQFARRDLSERLEDTLDVVLRQVWVNGGDVDPVVVLRLLRYVVDHDLSLRHVARAAHFYVAAGNYDSVHLKLIKVVIDTISWSSYLTS